MRLIERSSKILRLSAAAATGMVCFASLSPVQGQAQVPANAVPAGPAKAAPDAAADRPPYQINFGSLERGAALPDIKLHTPEGKEVALQDYLHGKTLLFVLDTDVDAGSVEYMEGLNKAYRSQGVQMLGVTTLTPREDFQRWHAKNKDRLSFPLLFDPSGPLPPPPDRPMSEYTQDDLKTMAAEWKAVADRSIEGRFLNVIGPPRMPPGAPSNMVLSWPLPGTPLVIVLDGDKKLVGWSGLGAPSRPNEPNVTMAEDAGGREGFGNLLQLAAIQPRAQDKPKRAYTLEMVQDFKKKMEAERARQRAMAVPLLAAGTMAPDFQIVDAGGKAVKLSDYRGKVVILDYWATWCGPCIASMPHMQALAKKYRDQGLVVLGAGTDDAEKALKAWILKNQPKYPDVVYAYDPKGRDPQRVANSRYGVSGLPTQFIIGRDGRIAGVTSGLSVTGSTANMEYYLSKAGLSVDADIVAKGAKEMKKEESASGARPASSAPAPGTTMMFDRGAVPPGAQMVPAKGMSVDGGTAGNTNSGSGEVMRLAPPQPAAGVDLSNAPVDIKFTAVDGRKVDLARMHGKVVLVDFWGIWCESCVAELPELKSLYQKYRQHGLEVIGISTEQAGLTARDTAEQTAKKLAAARKKLTDFLAARAIPWPVYFDGKFVENPFVQRYGVNPFPTYLLVGRDGKLFSRKNDTLELEAHIRQLLNLPG